MFAFPLPKNSSANNNSDSNKKKSVSSAKQQPQKSIRRKRDLVDAFAGLDNLFSKPKPNFLEESEPDSDDDDECLGDLLASNNNNKSKAVPFSAQPKIPQNSANAANQTNKRFVMNIVATHNSSSSFDTSSFYEDSSYNNQNNNNNNTSNVLSTYSSTSFTSELALHQRKQEDAVDRFLFNAKLLEGALASGVSVVTTVMQQQQQDENKNSSPLIIITSPNNSQQRIHASPSSPTSNMLSASFTTSTSCYSSSSVSSSQIPLVSAVNRVLSLLNDLLDQIEAEPAILRWAHRSGNGQSVVDAISNAISKHSGQWIRALIANNFDSNVTTTNSISSAMIALRCSFCALLICLAHNIPDAPAKSRTFFNSCLLVLTNFQEDKTQNNNDDNGEEEDDDEEGDLEGFLNSTSLKNKQKSSSPICSQQQNENFSGFASLLTAKSQQQNKNSQKLSSPSSSFDFLDEDMQLTASLMSKKQKNGNKNSKSNSQTSNQKSKNNSQFNDDNDDDREEMLLLLEKQQKLVSQLTSNSVSIISRNENSDEWNQDEVLEILQNLISNQDAELLGQVLRLFSCLGARAITQALLSANLNSYTNSNNMMMNGNSHDQNGNCNNNSDDEDCQNEVNNSRMKRTSTGGRKSFHSTRNSFSQQQQQISSSATKTQQLCKSTTMLFFNQQGWSRISSVLKECCETSSTNAIDKWNPVMHALTLLELVVSDPGALLTIELRWTQMEKEIVNCVKSMFVLLASDVEKFKKAEYVDDAEHEVARVAKRIESNLRCIMNVSRIAPIAFSEYLNIGSSRDSSFLFFIKKTFISCLELLLDSGDSSSSSSSSSSNSRIDIFSLAACAATALLMPPRIISSNHHNNTSSFVYDKLRRTFLLENGNKSTSSSTSLASVAADAMFALRHGRTEVSRNVASAYAASLLVALSLNSSNEETEDGSELGNSADSRVSVLTSIVAAATKHQATSQLGKSPMAYPVAVLQEFILFQSSHRLLTRETLIGLHFLIDRAVLENKIETQQHDENEIDENE